MTTGTEEGKSTAPDEGPGGVPLALRLSEGLGAWQPIETAPRDGRTFIGARFSEDEAPDYEIGCYDPMKWEKYEPDGDSGLFRKVVEIVHEWRGFNNYHRMTHWAEIPTVPAPLLPRLADGAIDRIAEAMPGGMDGFLKGWGWRQFARAVEDAHGIGDREAPNVRANLGTTE
jgi:hypothetical protein